MNERYLSLSDAESYTGKSRSSLRRFVEAITKPENHPDRRFIQPTIEEVAELHADNHPFSWKISQDLLDRAFKKEGPASSNQSDNVQSTTMNQMISLFEQTISMLNTELAEKNKQINEFQQRQRETNVLLQQTTERLVLLSDGTKRRPNATDDSITIHSSTANDSRPTEEGSESSDKWEDLYSDNLDDGYSDPRNNHSTGKSRKRTSDAEVTGTSTKKRSSTPKKPARKTLWQRLQTKLF